MTWLNLTTESGSSLLINADNAIQIKSHPSGSQVMFLAVVPNKEGKLHAKTVTVMQNPEQIAKALKAATVR